MPVWLNGLIFAATAGSGMCFDHYLRDSIKRKYASYFYFSIAMLLLAMLMHVVASSLDWIALLVVSRIVAGGGFGNIATNTYLAREIQVSKRVAINLPFVTLIALSMSIGTGINSLLSYVGEFYVGSLRIDYLNILPLCLLFIYLPLAYFFFGYFKDPSEDLKQQASEPVQLSSVKDTVPAEPYDFDLSETEDIIFLPKEYNT